MSRRTDHSRWATAHHEAGHAVAAFYFDHSINYVTIKPGKDFAGRCIRPPGYGRNFEPESGAISARQYVTMLDNIVISFAGHEAEAAHSGRQNWVGSRSDREKAADLALYISGGPEDASALLRWRRITARGLVETRWTEITAVAAALLDRETLTGGEVREAIRIGLGLPDLAPLEPLVSPPVAGV
jgi:hypothetical protein